MFAASRASAPSLTIRCVRQLISGPSGARMITVSDGIALLSVIVLCRRKRLRVSGHGLRGGGRPPVHEQRSGGDLWRVRQRRREVVLAHPPRGLARRLVRLVGSLE